MCPPEVLRAEAPGPLQVKVDTLGHSRPLMKGPLRAAGTHRVGGDRLGEAGTGHRAWL